jgi:hypothetical protein
VLQCCRNRKRIHYEGTEDTEKHRERLFAPSRKPGSTKRSLRTEERKTNENKESLTESTEFTEEELSCSPHRVEDPGEFTNRGDADGGKEAQNRQSTRARIFCLWLLLRRRFLCRWAIHKEMQIAKGKLKIQERKLPISTVFQFAFFNLHFDFSVLISVSSVRDNLSLCFSLFSAASAARATPGSGREIGDWFFFDFNF